jgi:hypothetical protein
MWEPQPLTTLRASKACRGENFTFTLPELKIRFEDVDMNRRIIKNGYKINMMEVCGLDLTSSE